MGIKFTTKYPLEIHVTQRELTCLDCGEVVAPCEGFCPRCRGDESSSFSTTGRNFVPTLSYLREGEYTEAKRELPLYRLLARAAVIKLMEHRRGLGF